MSASIGNVKIQGLEEINGKLKALRDMGIKMKHITKIKAMSAGAKPIVDEAKKLAPSRSGDILAGRSRKTIALGALHASGLKSKAGKRLGKKFWTLKQSIGTKFSTGVSRNELAIRMLVRKPTGHLIEFGHRTKQGKGKAKGYKPKPGGKSTIAAHPYLAVARDTKSEQAVSRLAEVIDKAITEAIDSHWANK